MTNKTTAITGIARIGYKYSDGGRAASGRSGKAADCVVRAAALLRGFADGLDPADFLTDVWGRLYDETYKRLAVAHRDGLGGRRTAREGIYRADYEPVFINDFGFVKINLGRGSKPTYSEAYDRFGPCIVKTTKHVCALIDGTLYDLSDGRIYDWFGELRERKAQCVYALPERRMGQSVLPSGGVYRRMTEAEYYGRDERDGDAELQLRQMRYPTQLVMDDINQVNRPNWVDRTIFIRDNLEVLRGMNSGSVDLVYLDPPFNKGKQWAAPIGSKAAGAAFKDAWTLSDVDKQDHDLLRTTNPQLHDTILAARAAGGNSTMSYLLMMSVRLLEIKRVLKPTGSLYLHCDPTESHGLKLMLDTIFTRDWFRNEIAWCYAPGGNAPKRAYHRKHDIILYYADKNAVGGVWNKPYGEMPAKTRRTYNQVDDDGRLFKTYRDRKTYLDEVPGRPVPSWWDDIPSFGTAVASKERTEYPTQKPIALLHRIIQASTNEGDVVLDPFCGCATTLIAAEFLQRKWVGIDLSEKAAELVDIRLAAEIGLSSSLVTIRDDIPIRTDQGTLPAPKTHKKALYGGQQGYCNGCGTHFEIENLTIDHIISKKKGGTDHPGNLQLLCLNCNSRKGTGSMSQLMDKLLKDREYRK